MLFNDFFKSLTILCLGTCFFFSGCGKKPELDNGTTVVSRPSQSQIDAYLEKQSVSCEGNQACPNYISKVVIVFGQEYKFCTGFLTDDNTVATSSSCLPNILRLNGQDCSKDIFFFFPKTATRPTEKVGCKQVFLASQPEGQDPILWRDDVAFLELDRSLFNRRQAQIVREGLQNGKTYSTWMIDQQDEHSALVKRAYCETVHNNYVNPLVVSDSSPNMIFAGCSLTKEGTGAPVLDNRGKVRGMMSRNMDSNLRLYLESTGLLIQPLKTMVHGSNFACAPNNIDTEMLDERECLRDLNYKRVDRYRSEMLSSNVLFSELRKSFENSLLSMSRYVKFGVKLIPKGDLQETEIYPKCFKPLNDWLPTTNANRSVLVDELELPVRTFKKGMDAYGMISAQTLEAPNKLQFVQMSLKSLRSTRKSSVLMWGHGDQDVLRTFQNLSEECED
jgi:hypothetical protein